MSYRDQVIADGASHYWRFTETSGQVLDAIGTAHGTISGTVNRGVPGALADGDPAINFPGTGFVALGVMALPVAWSIEAWVKQAAPEAAEFVWTNRVTDGTNPYLFLNAGFPQLGAAGVGNVVGSSSLADGQWHHVVGLSSGSTLQLFVDGVPVTAVFSLAVPATSGEAVIANDGIGGTSTFTALDEVALYPTALTPAQITNHYALRLATTYRQLVLSDGAVAYWPLGDASAPVLDVVGTRHGTDWGAVKYHQPGLDGAHSVGLIGSGGIDLPPLPTLLPQFSYEAWIWVDSLAHNHTILSRVAACRWMVLVAPGTDRVFSVYVDTITNVRSVSDGQIAVQRWFHVVVTHDGTTGRLYTNGVLDGSKAFALPAADQATFVASLGYDPASGNAFTGGLQDVAVYATALTPAQIAAHFASRGSPAVPIPSASGPVPWPAALVLDF